MKALCLIREALHYRRTAFCRGLRAAGYALEPQIDNPKPDDVLVIWQRYAGHHETANRFEKHGARVVVCENGYLGKDWRGGEWFSMAIGHHAGAGDWTYGGPQRWDEFDIELKPWREGGTETLVLAQRGIGESGIASPNHWAESTVRRLNTGRIRPHPGTGAKVVPLEDDLANASSVVTWASSAALKALIHGVPVWYEMPKWIGRRAARPVSEFGQEPLRDDARRLYMFRHLAWAIWEKREIESGEAFTRLLHGVSTGMSAEDLMNQDRIAP